MRRSRLGLLSVFANRLIPGALVNESLCGRAAREFGPDKWICRLIDWLMGEIGHCRKEIE